MAEILNDWNDIRNTRVIIEALMIGLSVKTTDGYEYQLDSTNTLCVVGTNQTTGEKSLLKVWCDFAGHTLLNLSKHVSEDEIVSLCADIALNRFGK